MTASIRVGYPFESGSLGSCRQRSRTIRVPTASCSRGSRIITRASTTWSGCAGPTGSAARGVSVERGWRLSSGRWECTVCGRQTSVTAGTIFHRTRTPLPTWFAAAWLMTSQKQGVSALGLQRALGLGSYQTAWAMLHRFRSAMVRPGRERLSGWVEVDEAYVGGLEGTVYGRETATKSIVAIAVEIKQPKGFGRIRLQSVPDVSQGQPDPVHRSDRRARGDGPHRWMAGVLDRARARLPARADDHAQAERPRARRDARRPPRRRACSSAGCSAPTKAGSAPITSTRTSTSSPSGSTAGTHDDAECSSTACSNSRSQLTRSPTAA